MNTGNRADRRPTTANRLQDVDDFVERRGRCRKQKRGGAAAPVEIANRAKRFFRCIHRVATERAMQMKIDKTGRKIISVKINDVIFPARFSPFACSPYLRGSRVNRRDFPFLYDHLKSVANSIRKDQTSIAKNHCP
jgi:hypothetical protein